MDYSKKVFGSIVLIAICMCITAGLSYILVSGAHWLIPVCCFVISPLLGYLFTYKGNKHNNKELYVCSMIFYSIFISSIVGGLFVSKKLSMDLKEVVQLTSYCFVLISVIYILVAKTTNIVLSGGVGIGLIALSSLGVWKMSDVSLISKQLLWYGLAMLILVVFHYITALVSKKKNINIIKAMSNGFGGIFWIVAALATDGVTVLPTNDDNEK